MRTHTIVEPPHLKPLFDRAGPTWSEKEILLVTGPERGDGAPGWLWEETQYFYLLHFVLTHLPLKDFEVVEQGNEHARDTWRNFYAKKGHLVAEIAEKVWLNFYTSALEGVIRSYNPPMSFPLLDLFDVKNRAPLFVRTWRDGNDALTRHLRAQLRDETRQRLHEDHGVSSPLPDRLSMLIDDLNGILQGVCIYSDRLFSQVVLRLETQQLLAQQPRGDDLVLLNRLLLEDAYRTVIIRRRRFWNYLLFCLERYCHREGGKEAARLWSEFPLTTESETGEEIEIQIVDDHPDSDPEERMIKKDLLKKLLQAIVVLLPAYRQVIVMHYFEEKSVAQIAEELGITIQNVKVRLFRARRMLGGGGDEPSVV